MRVDLVDPHKLDQARRLLGTSSTRATLDLALELLLAQSELLEPDDLSDATGVPDSQDAEVDLARPVWE